MAIAIRVDASFEMGLGHVRRCLSLARALSTLGFNSVFVVRELGVDLSLITDAGFELLRLPAPSSTFVPEPASPAHAHWAGIRSEVDSAETVSALRGRALRWIVIDHYAFDASWHRAAAQGLSVQVAVVDDLADREIDAELLIDHNLASNHAMKYAHTGSRIGRLLGGPRYALLDPEYRNAPRYLFSETVHSVGIFLGGTDPWNASIKAHKVLREQAGFRGRLELVTTSANPQLEVLRTYCESDDSTVLLVDLPGLQNFYARNDLQVGAGGGAAWERCCIGAPTLLLALADNQSTVAAGLQTIGAARWVNSHDPAEWGKVLAELLLDTEARRSMSLVGRSLVDGQGSKRVAIAMTSSELVLRPATPPDAIPCHVWRNAEETRRFFRNASPVALADHLRWWQASLANPQRYLLIAQVGNEAIGVIRLDRDGSDAEVSIYTDPTLAGLGLGRRMLDAVAQWATGLEIGLHSLVAEIDPRNTVSEAAFAACGFRCTAPGRWTRSLIA